MQARRPKVLVVCPGRGTYNKGELGYLARHHARRADFLAMADAYRTRQGQPTLRELDSSPTYNTALLTRGDHASPLIFACAFADFLALDRVALDVVAVTGNSMGWYTALACAGVLTPEHALAVVNTMGREMHNALVGAQAIFTLVDEDWRTLPGRRELLLDTLRAAAGQDLHLSIDLGGMLVLAGRRPDLDAAMARVPKGPGPFPMLLQNHAGFHTPLQAPIAAKAKAMLPADGFRGPTLPLIDGRGHIWRPAMSPPQAIWDYTLGAQVVGPYDFASAIRVGVREFGPDCIVLLGPGDTLGGAIAQSLIAAGWRGLESKTAFLEMQAQAPFLISMGREDQRALAI